MNQTSSIICALPCCTQTQKSQTNLSIVLRITAIAIGIISTLVGVLTLCNIPVLNQLGTTGGGVLASAGALFILAGISVKCVTNSHHKQKVSRSKSAGQLQAEIPSQIKTALPSCITPFLGNVPYLILKASNFSLDDFNDISSPLFVFSVGVGLGIYMKLQAKYIPESSSIQVLVEDVEDKPLISSKKPFSLRIIMMSNGSDHTKWMLVSEDLTIEHRNDRFSTSQIFGTGFSYSEGHHLDQTIITKFLEVEKQDELPVGYENDLGWVLLRLLKKQPLLIKEGPLHQPAIGYWRLSLVEPSEEL